MGFLKDVNLQTLQTAIATAARKEKELLEAQAADSAVIQEISKVNTKLDKEVDEHKRNIDHITEKLVACDAEVGKLRKEVSERGLELAAYVEEKHTLKSNVDCLQVGDTNNSGSFRGRADVHLPLCRLA
jgi:chromosome segregation ATPase